MDRDPKTGQFLNGNSGGGRPKGQRNYATIYREALRKIAEEKGMSPEEVEEEIHTIGIKKALEGDFSFYKDTLDRLNGKPTQTTTLNTDTSLTYGVIILPEKETAHS